MKRKMKSGDEYDAFTRWRHVHFWHPGERKKIKRRVNRRDRHEVRQDLKEADRRTTDAEDAGPVRPT